MTNFTDEPEKFFSRDTICDNSLQPNVDFNWTIERTSYALEWGFICSEENKAANLKSVFFVGAFIGMILGTALFDKIGRKTTSLIVITLSAVSALATTFVTSYSVLLPLRIIHGIGAFATVTGVELLTVEFTPSNLRNLCQLVSSCYWTFGAFCIIGVSYGVKKWQHIYLVEGCILVVTALAVCLLPESPRFHLIKGKDKKARATFTKISKIFNTEETLEKAELVFEDYDQSYLDQVKDFKKYPLMLKNTLILMVSWLMISTISYGLLFSWGKLGADIYTSILFSSLGSFIAKGSGMIYFIIHYFGRKKAVVINFAGVAFLFFLSIPSFEVRITETWYLGHVACLCTLPFISGVWGSVTLLTKELSPTSHRGMIFCTVSAASRVGSFIGPYFALLYNIMDRRIVLAIYGGMAALSSFLAYLNSDSTDKPFPSTPEDLTTLSPAQD